MLAKGGAALTAVAVVVLLAASVGAAVGVELPLRPTIEGTPVVQTEPPVETEAPVPVEPLPDPTPTTTIPAARPNAPQPQAATGSSGGTQVSFTLAAR